MKTTWIKGQAWSGGESFHLQSMAWNWFVGQKKEKETNIELEFPVSIFIWALNDVCDGSWQYSGCRNFTPD